MVARRINQMMKIKDPNKDQNSKKLLKTLYVNWIKNYRETESLEDYPETEEFRSIMIELMNRSKSDDTDPTMKIQRPIGFRGKTRIVGIIDTEEQDIVYRDQASDVDFEEILDSI